MIITKDWLGDDIFERFKKEPRLEVIAFNYEEKMVAL